MTASRKRRAPRNILAVALGGFALTLLSCKQSPPPPTTFQGAIIRADSDTSGQIPLEGADVTATNGTVTVETKSDSSGYFRVTLRPGLSAGELATLQFHAADYKPLQMIETAGRELLVVHMVPLPRTAPQAQHRPEITIANPRVRYTAKMITTQNVGSEVATFQVKNTGNVPCAEGDRCSPDGRWRANIASKSLDAGQGNEFRNVRVSCIAGPCPFTKESENQSNAGRNLEVSVLDWSDTTTFLIEAEVTHTMVSNLVRESVPPIFNDTMNFTLPAGSEGPSIMAEVNGTNIVFPLGPDLWLNWASCAVKTGQDQTKLFRCEIKPGYRFANK